ncbi:hypothetical protein FB451DRAFT_1435608, partial [Mycena latifolia]
YIARLFAFSSPRCILSRRFTGVVSLVSQLPFPPSFRVFLSKGCSPPASRTFTATPLPHSLPAYALVGVRPPTGPGHAALRGGRRRGALRAFAGRVETDGCWARSTNPWRCSGARCARWPWTSWCCCPREVARGSLHCIASAKFALPLLQLTLGMVRPSHLAAGPRAAKSSRAAVGACTSYFANRILPYSLDSSAVLATTSTGFSNSR